MSEKKSRKRLWDSYYKQGTRQTAAKFTGAEKILFRLPGTIRNMLDVGCGEGDYVRAWAGRNVMACGMDISAVAIERAISQTPPQLHSHCMWRCSDWEEIVLDDLGWRRRFDLVYSCMGPDMEKDSALEKFMLISRKYCRLVLYHDGENTILNGLKKYFPTADICNTDKSSTERLLEKIETLGCRPQLESFVLTAEWKQDFSNCLQYLHKVHYPQKEKNALRRALLELAGGESEISSVTRVQYSMITWQV